MKNGEKNRWNWKPSLHEWRKMSKKRIALGLFAVSCIVIVIVAWALHNPRLSAAETLTEFSSLVGRAVLLLNQTSEAISAVVAGSVSLKDFSEEMKAIEDSFNDLLEETRTLKGKAHIEYLESLDCFEEGLEYYIESVSYAEELKLQEAQAAMSLGTAKINEATEKLP